MECDVKSIHDASMEILEHTGILFYNEESREILKKHGIHIKGKTAYFTEEQVMYWIHKAPSFFHLYAKNEEHNIIVGGEHINAAPGYGAPYISNQKGEKRFADAKDFVKLVRLFHQCPSFHLNGGVIVQPCDMDVNHSLLLMYYTAFLNTDKCMVVGAGEKRQIQAIMDMACAACGGKEEIMTYPKLITLVNTNTPLKLDKNMTDTLMLFARYRQPVVVASLAQGGLTAPLTLAGTMVLTNAEVLAGIVLAQMISPGTPVVYGAQSTIGDMRSGATATGSAEGALCCEYGSKLARFYGLPCRGGGALTDAKIVSGQSGYESMLTLLHAYDCQVNFILHSAGIMDGYASMSYEKVLQDMEIIAYIERLKRGIEVTKETLAADLIHDIGHKGQYLTDMHTLKYCRTEPMIPAIGVRGEIENPGEAFDQNIERQMEKMLENYVQPIIARDKKTAMENIMIENGVTRAEIEEINGL